MFKSTLQKSFDLKTFITNFTIHSTLMVGLILLKCTFLLITIKQILEKSKFKNLLSKHFFNMNMYTFFSVN